MKRPSFQQGHLYHIYNRGVEKRLIFLNDKDRFRFIHNLYEFNDEEPVLNSGYSFIHQHAPHTTRLQSKKKPFVEILAFCLMPNHYHIMVNALSDVGVTEFMRKLGTGYTNYFNQKYQRVGPLFQGKFKAVLLEQEAHFIYLPYYIHFNPLELNKTSAKGGTTQPIDFLRSYRWSSHRDYLGIPNFPEITQRTFLEEYIGGARRYTKNVEEMLESKNFTSIEDILIDQD